MYSIKSILTIAMLFMSSIGNATDVDIYRLINSFDSNRNQVEVANKFFKELRLHDFIDEEVVFTSSVPLDSVRQMFYYYASEWYSDSQDYERAKQYGLKALPLCKEGSIGKADCLNLLGCVYVRMGDFASGVTYTKQCLDLDLKSGDNDRIASSFSTLAGTYIAADDPDAALKFSLKGLEYADKAHNSLRKTIIMGMISEAYCKKEEYDKALKYADEAYKIDSIEGRQNRAAIRLSQKAAALVGLEKYAEAETTFRRTFPILIESKNYHSLAIDYNQLGFMLLKQKRNKDAINYFREASKLFGKMEDLYNQVHSQRGLYESYWDINPDSARFALQRFNMLKDSLYREATADALARYKAAFETDRLKEEVNEHILNRERDYLIGIMSFLFIACTVIIMLVYINRLRRSQKNRLKCQEEKMHSTFVPNITHDSRDSHAETQVAAQELFYEAEPDSISGDDETSVISESDKNFVEKVSDAVKMQISGGKIDYNILASTLCLSRAQLNRKIKAITGETTTELILKIKISLAKDLLDNTDKPIIEIAMDCGMDSDSYFCTLFKKATGQTPLQYRNRKN